jgi:FkbM family methyltransferase
MTSFVVYRLWLITGVRPRFLSSKGQDRWICCDVFPGLRNGFFLEVGAGNGFIGSDSFVLETDYGWAGICVEPNPFLFHELTALVRRNCKCLQTCLDRTPGERRFVFSGDTSGIIADDTDNNMTVRGERLTRLEAAGLVQSIAATTVGALLEASEAPPIIHYFSIDVEGAEERILESFPFDRYMVLALTVERPTPRIQQLLNDAGLVLVKYKWHDGFYLHRDIWNGEEASPRFTRKEF